MATMQKKGGAKKKGGLHRSNIKPKVTAGPNHSAGTENIASYRRKAPTVNIKVGSACLGMCFVLPKSDTAAGAAVPAVCVCVCVSSTLTH